MTSGWHEVSSIFRKVSNFFSEKKNFAKQSPGLVTYIADKVVIRPRSRPTSTFRYSGYALSFRSRFDALVELFCVVQSFRLIRRSVQKNLETSMSFSNRNSNTLKYKTEVELG